MVTYFYLPLHAALHSKNGIGYAVCTFDVFLVKIDNLDSFLLVGGSSNVPEKCKYRKRGWQSENTHCRRIPRLALSG